MVDSKTRIREYIRLNFPQWEKVDYSEFGDNIEFDKNLSEFYRINGEEIILISYTNISITGTERLKPQFRVFLNEYKYPFYFAKKHQIRYYLFSIFTKADEMARGLDNFDPKEYVISIETNLDNEDSRRDLRSIYEYANGHLKGKYFLKCSRSNYNADINQASFIYIGSSDAPETKYFEAFVNIFDSRPYLDSIYQENDIQTSDNISTDQPLQQIFYGAPGTGKSHEIQERTKGCDVIRTTFHPDSDYASFVGAYKPTMEHLPLTDEKGQTIQVANTILYKDQITYSFVKQAFLQSYLSAWKKYQENPDNPKEQYLIIEEINRGNCAQIFGDLFQLLDRQDNGFSTYPIQADGDMKKAIQKAFAQETDYKLNATLNVEGVVENYKSFSGKTLSEDIVNGDILLLPSNLYIWATMNTSDQSLFPIDSAFKRRWEWKYMKIANMEKGYKIEVNGKHYDWWKFIDKMNTIIGAATSSEDKKLGYFFCKVKEGTTDITAEQFVSKVLFYIYGDALKDYDIKDDSFKKGEKDGKKIYYSFSDFYDAKGKVDKEMVAKLLDTFIGADEKVTNEESQAKDENTAE